MEFLELAQKSQMQNYSLPHLDATDKHVIVIGGGDTGVDCIGTSVRMVSEKKEFVLVKPWIYVMTKNDDILS